MLEVVSMSYSAFRKTKASLPIALLRARDAVVAKQGGLYVQDQNDLAASFQAAVSDVLAEKTRRALRLSGVAAIAVAGGVAANQTLRKALEAVSDEANTPFVAPPLALCTDNAAMIGISGYFKYIKKSFLVFI